MKAVRYNLFLESPVLATEIEGDPNSAVSAPYIPGSMLRGAVVARYLQYRQVREFDAATDREARGLFLSDQTLYLNAYPYNPHAHQASLRRRALPVPGAWQYNKIGSSSAQNGSRMVYNLSRLSGVTDFQKEGIGACFSWVSGDTVHLFSPPRQVNVHTQRDAEKGRSLENLGAVYRYDSLASGLHLQAVVLVEDQYAGLLGKLLREATLWIGRARRAGYGQVRVTDPTILDIDGWHEWGNYYEEPEELDSTLQVTFTSDTLLRDVRGQPTLDPRATLQEALGVKLTLQGKYTFAAVKEVGGFNRKWGLPLAQVTAIRAGSVFTYEPARPVEGDAVEKLEQTGIGERRAEGFGRLLVNRYLRDLYTGHEYKISPPPPELGALSPEEEALARRVAQRLLRSHLDRKLGEQVNQITISGAATNHQLSRLRVLLRELQADVSPEGRANLSRLKGYLEHLKARRSTRSQFENTRVNLPGKPEMPLLKWIQDLTQDPKANWSVPEIDLGRSESVILAQLDDSLAEEYTLRLIDGVLHKRTRESAISRSE